jgi:hypothetical protein
VKETAHHHPFTYRFDNPTTAVQENGTYGGQGKAVGSQKADGFAVSELDLFVLAITSQKIDLQSDPLASDIEGRW